MRFRHLILVTTAMAGLTGAAHAQDGGAAAPTQADENGNDIVVTGYRKSLQDAIETKRLADSIVDVSSAQGVCKLPDNNIAESVASAVTHLRPNNTRQVWRPQA